MWHARHRRRPVERTCRLGRLSRRGNYRPTSPSSYNLYYADHLHSPCRSKSLGNANIYKYFIYAIKLFKVFIFVDGLEIN